MQRITCLTLVLCAITSSFVDARINHPNLTREGDNLYRDERDKLFATQYCDASANSDFTKFDPDKKGQELFFDSKNTYCTVSTIYQPQSAKDGICKIEVFSSGNNLFTIGNSWYSIKTTRCEFPYYAHPVTLEIKKSRGTITFQNGTKCHVAGMYIPLNALWDY